MNLNWSAPLLKRYRLFGAAMLFWHAAAVVAEPLDWQSCVREAVGANADLSTSRHAVDAAQAQVDQSRAAFLPQLAANAGVSKSAGDNEQSLVGDKRWKTSDQYSYEVALKQNIFAGYRDEATASKRGAELEQAEALLKNKAVTLAFDLRTAFVQHLYVQQLIDLQRQVVKRQRENVRLVELKFEGGRENKGSLLRSRALLSQSEADLAQAERALAVAQVQLAKVLGRPQESSTVVQGELVVPSISKAIDLQQAARENPAVRAAMAAARASRFAVDAAHGAAYPELAANAAAGRSGSAWPPTDRRLSIGLSLSMPLYTGGSLKAEKRAAEAGHAKSENEVTVALQAVQKELAEAQAGLADAVAQVGVQIELRAATVLQEEIARNQYALGLLTFQEWDQIESNLNNADRGLLSSRKNAAVAYASWLKALGLTLTEASDL